MHLQSYAPPLPTQFYTDILEQTVLQCLECCGTMECTLGPSCRYLSIYIQLSPNPKGTMCLPPGVPRSTEGTSACCVDEAKVLQVGFSQNSGGKSAFHSSLLIKSVPLDCKKQDFKLFFLRVLALVSPLNDSGLIPRVVRSGINLVLM